MEEQRRKEEVRVFLPPAIIDRIDYLVDQGFYDTRSEVVRDVLVRHFLPDLSEVPMSEEIPKGIVRRVFKHYDAEFHFVANFDKLHAGNRAVRRLAGFLAAVAKGRVPKNFGFALRVTDITLNTQVAFGEIRKSRFEVSGRHEEVLPKLVEDRSTPMVACEVPLWSRDCFVCGHADLIEVTGREELPIFIWDYKPNLSSKGVVQLCLYRMLLARALALPERLIGIGVFDNSHEVVYK